MTILSIFGANVQMEFFLDRDDPHQASDTDVGGRCCEVSGNGLDRHHGHRQCKISSSHQRHHRRTSYDGNEDCIEEESSMSGTSSSGGGGGGGQHFTAGNPRQQHHRAPHSSGNNEYEQPVLSERDRKELMSLANENISMDFILEMKEAFQLFDKVTQFSILCAPTSFQDFTLRLNSYFMSVISYERI